MNRDISKFVSASVLADYDKLTDGAQCPAVPDIGAEDFIALFARGSFPIEAKDGFGILTAKYHELIPVVFHVPHGMRKTVRQGGFSFTTNQHFEHVMNKCSALRDGEDPGDQWILHRMKRNLRELRELECAHSIETYRDGVLVGGILGVQINGLFASLSVYSTGNGTGNAAFLALQAILCRRNFVVHDALLPSNISRAFGGFLVPSEVDRKLRHAALTSAKTADFPTFTSQLSLNKFVEPLQNG